MLVRRRASARRWGLGLLQFATGAGATLCAGSGSRGAPRGNIVFLPAYESKHICNHHWLAPGRSHQRSTKEVNHLTI